MGYVLVSCGSNYNFAIGNNTYVTTECDEVVEHLRSILEEKMAENIYTRGNYKLKAPPIKVLDALIGIGFSVVSSGGSEGRFIWTLVKGPLVTSHKVTHHAVGQVTSGNENTVVGAHDHGNNLTLGASPIDLHSYSPESIINA